MPLAPPITEIQQPAVGIYGLPIGASAGPMVLLTAAQIRAIAEITAPDLSGYVPYTGATANVNLGTRNLVTTGTLGAGATTVGALTCGAITASGDVTLSGSQTLWALNVRSTVNTWNIIGASGNIDTLGTLDIRTATNSTTAFRVRNAALSNVIVVDTTNRTFAAGGDAFAVRNSTGGTYLFNGGFLAVTNSTDASSAAADTFLSRASAGVWRFGTTSTGTDAGIQCGAITASGAVVCAGITSTSGVDVQALLRCDSFRIDQTPTSEVVVCTHTITVSVNGTNYKIPCVAA